MVGSSLLVLINFAKFATIAIYLSSAIIVYHCLSNIWALFEPQLCKTLIINTFNILHRSLEYHNKLIIYKLQGISKINQRIIVYHLLFYKIQ